MILPDVNLLIYACRRDVPLHRVSRSWLDSTIESEARFAISKLTLSAFVRITTNSRAYRIPTSLTDAFAFCDNLLGQPHCEVIEPGEGHWDIFRRLCIATNTRGNDLADAWYAALAIEWGCEWVTFDRGFARFPELKCTILQPPA